MILLLLLIKKISIIDSIITNIFNIIFNILIFLTFIVYINLKKTISIITKRYIKNNKQ